MLLQVMMYSHVAKGFWLEAPYGLAAALGARDTMMVDLECSNTTVTVADMVNRDADGLWEAKLLMRSNKRAFGFSGGWRGFAKDQVGCWLVTEIAAGLWLNFGGWCCAARHCCGAADKPHMGI